MRYYPGRHQLAQITVLSSAFTTAQTGHLTATLNGSWASSTFLFALPTTSVLKTTATAKSKQSGGAANLDNAALSCDASVQAGNTAECQVSLAAPASEPTQLSISSSSESVKTPAAFNCVRARLVPASWSPRLRRDRKARSRFPRT